MNYRVAINGFGRIGRNYLRCLLDRGLLDQHVDVVAVNDLWPTPTLAHLLVHDSTFGRLRWDVGCDAVGMTVDGHRIEVTREPDPTRLHWGDRGIDLVVEATGTLPSRDAAEAHLKANAQRVLITAPARDADATLVMGVNEASFDPARHRVVSAASCTTNCLATMAKVLDDDFGVLRGYLTAVHAYTNDQMLLDSAHVDPRRARSSAVNIVPTSTGAAAAIGEVLPELAGRLTGTALRVPVEDGSVCDLTCLVSRPVTPTEVNAAFAAAAAGAMTRVLRYTDQPVVSRDVVGDPASCVLDGLLTQAHGTLVKVFGWYDNEWGYTNRLVDLSLMLAARR
ncbi:MAG TPA: type I glyceraldehyde-3-phosphate dehydrogenase [Micromonosporaceae bacterium]